MSDLECRALDAPALIATRAEFRDARERVLKDVEAFDAVIFAVERLGVLLTERIGDLGKYERCICQLAEASPMAHAIPVNRRVWHVPFRELYTLVRQARNDAVHQGAYARHLTEHVVQLSLVLEDALMIKQQESSEMPLVVADFMVRSVVGAQPWEPLSFVRQQMLSNAFSYLPLHMDHHWFLVSDLEVARFLRVASEDSDQQGASGERKRRLAMTVEEAQVAGLRLIPADDRTRPLNSSVAEVTSKLDGLPLLVVDPARPGSIQGILMAFDLL
jgi:hypothetical protein